ncbi:DotI/IcmL/TraM family protein [Vibrio alginolyticus]|uniref:DotI/IcmL/TraM family protein n=1 Tax=Vibrio alginolyticus TaxID=663 RepID=UPI0015F5D59F|nr:DotI/IcmL/TraM family protein [Vibrio alginolyticus]
MFQKSHGNGKANNAKKIIKSTEGAPVENELILEPGVLEYAIRSQAKLIKSLRRDKWILSGALFCSLFIIGVKQDPELPEPTYFTADANGKITEITPLSEPFTNSTAIRNWSEECILKALDVSFTQPISKVNETIQECFSQAGQIGYVTWLLQGKSSQTLKVPNGPSKFVEIPVDSEYAEIINQKITMNASKIAPARMKTIKPEVINGESIARWELELPVVIQKFRGAEGTGRAKYTIKVTLKRTNNQAREVGVDLDSWSIIRG